MRGGNGGKKLEWRVKSEGKTRWGTKKEGRGRLAGLVCFLLGGVEGVWSPWDGMPAGVTGRNLSVFSPKKEDFFFSKVSPREFEAHGHKSGQGGRSSSWCVEWLCEILCLSYSDNCSKCHACLACVSFSPQICSAESNREWRQIGHPLPAFWVLTTATLSWWRSV